MMLLFHLEMPQIHPVKALNMKRLTEETQFINDSVELPKASIWNSFIIYFTAWLQFPQGKYLSNITFLSLPFICICRIIIFFSE